jgi:hypothetical protein
LFGSGPNAPILPQNDPMVAFNDLFKDVVEGAGTPAGMVDPAMMKVLRRRQSILDAVKDELTGLRCLLGTEERHKFDGHLKGIRDVEVSLVNTTGGAANAACKKPQHMAVDWKAPANYEKAIRAQMDNAVAALSCDVTRVIAIQCERWQSPFNFKEFIPDVYSDSHHSIVHGGPDKTKNLTLIETWYAKQFAYLVGKLNAVDENGGKMLDSCAVLWLHEQANAPDHTRYDHAVVLAGGQGGYFKTNDMLDFRDGTKVNVSKLTNPTKPGDYHEVDRGESYARLLIDLAYSMGVPFDPKSPPLNANFTAEEKSYFEEGPLTMLRA